MVSYIDTSLQIRKYNTIFSLNKQILNLISSHLRILVDSWIKMFNSTVQI